MSSVRRSRRPWSTIAASLLLLGLPATGSASAQAPTSPPPASAAPTSPIDGVTLTAMQRSKLRALTAETRERQRAILGGKQRGEPPTAAERQELTRIALAHNAALRVVLTPAQRDRFDGNVRARQDAREALRGARKADSVGGH